MTAPTTRDVLRESEMTAYLEKEKARYAAGDPNAIVADYCFTSFQLSQATGFSSARFGNLALFRSVRSQVFAVSENYMQVR